MQGKKDEDGEMEVVLESKLQEKEEEPEEDEDVDNRLERMKKVM